MEYGIVYLLTNPVMPGLVKIGMTTMIWMLVTCGIYKKEKNMVTDNQTNKVYFSKRLTWYKCWKELSTLPFGSLGL